MIALFLAQRAARAQQMCRIQAGQPGAAGNKAEQDEQEYTSHESIREQNHDVAALAG
jgi:hypothetical protein